MRDYLGELFGRAGAPAPAPEPILSQEIPSLERPRALRKKETPKRKAPAPSPRRRFGTSSPAPVDQPASGRGPAVVLGAEADQRLVFWRPAELRNAFVLIVGASGSGKTQALRLFGSDLSRGQVPVVFFDVHGDLELPGFESVDLGVRIGINPLQLPSTEPGAGGPERHAAEVVDAVRIARRAAGGAQLGDSQAYTLKEALLDAYRAAGFTENPSTWRSSPPTLSSVLELLKRRLECGGRPEGPGSLRGLLGALDGLFGDPCFRQETSLSPERLARGRLRINLASVPASVQRLAIDTLLRQLFWVLRSRGIAPERTLRSFVICDEAKQLTTSPMLPRLFNEARKFGLGMALASQFADHFGKELRGTAATKIVLPSESAEEAKANAKDLDVPAARVRELDRPGAALLRTQAGTQRLQLRRLKDGG